MNPITTVRLQSTSSADQAQVPSTFGHVFEQGHLPGGSGLVGKIAGAPDLPLQVDAKATHPDGSIRHAMISGVLPTLGGGKTISVDLIPAKAVSVSPTPIRLGFDSVFKATIDGVAYIASLDELLKAGVRAVWLDGPTVAEWQVSAPLKTTDGAAHPHLHARFAVRWYEAAKKARIDISIENDWAYEQSPTNFTYEAEWTVGGKVVASEKVTHLHHARWRRIAWTDGVEPGLNVMFDREYLIATKAIPNYELLTIPESVIADLDQRFKKTNRSPMGTGLITPYMPSTGGRDDIGIMPSWCVLWLLSQDARAKEAMLRTADLAGSFGSHYRDRNTDRPISLEDYPYMTINGRETDTGNPRTGKREAFPYVYGGTPASPNTFDCSHHPSVAYLAYLAEGDYYYLEQLQFWAMWCAFQTNPGYRQAGLGLMQSEQLRGQAWALRTLGQAAYISPDKDSLKGTLIDIVNNNLDWYTSTYAKNPDANKISIIANGYAISDMSNTGYKPWQDDFFMSVMGHLIELGFEKAKPVAQWKAGFQIGRLLDPEFCRTDAAMYVMKVRDSEQSAIYGSFGEAWRKSVDQNIISLKCDSVEQLAYRNAHRGSDEGTPFVQGEIIGYSHGNMGYPSNLQPAVAAAADYGPPAGKEAYRVFMSRSVKPDYRSSPQFNILPRTVKTDNTMPTPAPTPSPTPAPATLPSTVTIGAKPKDDVAGTWSKIGNENETVKIAVGTFLRYGAPGKAYVYGQATATSVALNNATWGDPAVQVVKQGEAFKADPPKAAGKIKTGANKLLAKQKGLQVTVIDPNTLASVKVFANVAASSTGILTISDVSLTVGAVYALKVVDANGKILDIIYPATATK